MIKSLIPFVVFLLLYVCMGVWLSLDGDPKGFYQFPAPSCALIAMAVALLLAGKNVNRDIGTFLQGAGNEMIMLMCLIFLLAGAFSSVTTAMGGVDATVNLGLSLLPDRLLLPGLFLISCFVSFSVGTSTGTIATLTPIVMGMADKTGLPLALTVGAMIGGAMFGDNLSVISDTTVAATSTQGCDMRSKLAMNFKIALPAAILVAVALTFFSHSTGSHVPGPISPINTLPYLAVLLLALSGMHVVVVLMVGITFAALLGMYTGEITFLTLGKTIYSGFMSVTDVFFLSIFIAGLAKLAQAQGGITLLLKQFNRFSHSRRTAEMGIAGIVSVADVCVANNTVAIVVTGDMCRQIAKENGISPARSASIMDMFSCVWQGLIPHGAQLLLAGSLVHLSPFQLIPYTWYPMALGVFAVLAILFQFPKSKKATEA